MEHDDQKCVLVTPNERAPSTSHHADTPTEVDFQWHKSAIAAGIGATLTACGGWDDDEGYRPGQDASAPPGQDPNAPPSQDPNAPPGQDPNTPPGQPLPLAVEDAARFLLEAQFSASEAEIAAVREQGYEDWLQQQLDTPLDVKGWDWLAAKAAGSEVLTVDNMIWRQLIKGANSVRTRLALALSEVFVVSAYGLSAQSPHFVMAHYWDTLADGVSGNFRQLLEDITLNPAMGYFLSTRGNLKEDASGRQPDENYAREVMQLMTIGLVQLEADGTPKKNSDGSPILAFNESDVINLSRVFTGYDVDTRAGGIEWTRRPMLATEANHSTLESRFLGVTVPANTPAAAALKIALDTLFMHPNVGPFIGRRLIQRLVTSNPSPSYVGRVASAFADNGRGIRGDMRSVFKAILLDVEARGRDTLANPTFGHLREPFVRVVQWARTFGLTSTGDKWALGDLTESIGQSPLRAPSVFNFFRPTYIPPNSGAAAKGLVAPEFSLISETTLADYQTYLVARISSPLESGSPAPAYLKEMDLVLDPMALLQRLNLLLAAGQVSQASLAQMAKALEQPSVVATSESAVKLNRVCAAILLLMSSPEYLIQK
jgi:uncharacterized protein (DUF1800 family)